MLRESHSVFLEVFQWHTYFCLFVEMLGSGSKLIKPAKKEDRKRKKVPSLVEDIEKESNIPQSSKQSYADWSIYLTI